MAASAEQTSVSTQDRMAGKGQDEEENKSLYVD